MTRVFNFSAGPAALPVAVLEQLRDDRGRPESGDAQQRDGAEESMQLRFHGSISEQALAACNWLSIDSSVRVAARACAAGIDAASSVA